MITINNSDRLHESKMLDLNEAQEIHAGVNVLTLIRPLCQFDTVLPEISYTVPLFLGKFSRNFG